MRVSKWRVRTETRDRFDAMLERAVLPAGMIRHGGFRSDLVHVTGCGEGPSAQSWRNIDIRTLPREFGFFVASENSNVTDADGVVHCDRIDTTTLSPECQQPCSTDPPQSRWNPGIPYAATLLTASSGIQEKPLDPCCSLAISLGEESVSS